MDAIITVTRDTSGPRSGGWGPAKPLPKGLNDQFWGSRMARIWVFLLSLFTLQPLDLSAPLSILLIGLLGRWNSYEALKSFSRVPLLLQDSKTVLPKMCMSLVWAILGEFEQWLMDITDQCLCHRNRTSSHPTSSWDSLWGTSFHKVLVYCVLADSRGHLSHGLEMQAVPRAQRCEITHRLGGHADCCSLHSLLILKHCIYLISGCSWLHCLLCLLGTAHCSFTTSEWRGSFGPRGGGSPGKLGASWQ